jgi:hypothetical protein
MKQILMFAFLSIMLIPNLAFSERGNQPCSKGKGGVKACVGGRYLCNDGTFSQSKKRCSGYFTPGSENLSNNDRLPGVKLFSDSPGALIIGQFTMRQ